MLDDLRVFVFEVDTWGWIGLAASERGLRLLTLPVAGRDVALDAVRREYPDTQFVSEDAFLLEVARQVRAYLAGELSEFTVALDLRGQTSFALAVWAVAGCISYGQTRTYRWIADQVGDGPGAYQAVGAALGANPVPLIIPCHRVLGSDGSLHGYAGGLGMKARLLALESGQAMLELE
jgi:O-6-methylguanine DNA methyltransferase